ncbi:hypothetical protein HBB16_18650 [Pseudonocardia sp. MCCB 268]|nr:hypothetical protein [Pseudonocardia cytotoxica]
MESPGAHPAGRLHPDRDLNAVAALAGYTAATSGLDPTGLPSPGFLTGTLLVGLLYSRCHWWSALGRAASVFVVVRDRRASLLPAGAGVRAGAPTGDRRCSLAGL